MRDRFVGDVGDFGKYGLLRALCGHDLRLGIVWYFVRDRMIEYLNDPGRFEACDSELFEVLKRTVEGCQRTITSIEASSLFPKGAVFFPEEVPQQLEKRAAWRQRAMGKAESCDVLFFDPDNGLKDGDPPKQGLSAKFAYSAELAQFAARGQSLVVYHSLNMTQRHGAQILAAAENLAKNVGNATIWALRWRPFLPRAYFIIPHGREAVLRPRVEAMLRGPWGQHFEAVLFP